MLHVFLTVACFVAGNAYAHGDKQVRKPATDAALAEQKDFGKAGNPRRATRIVKLAMDDNMRFTPNRITVKQGETIKFIAVNRGRMLHEMVIGTLPELEKHAELMRQFPDMEPDEPHMVRVKAGNKMPLTWTFNRPGEFHFACLIAGHFEAGMVGTITVVAAGDRTH